MGQKFLAPAAVLWGLNQVLLQSDVSPEESPRTAQLAYPGGIYPLYSPLFAAFDVGTMTRPPAFEVPAMLTQATVELLGGDTDRATKAAKRAAIKVGRSHVPLVSTSWNSFDRMYEIIHDEESPLRP